MANKNLISDPTIRLPGFNLGRSAWSVLNCFRTRQGRCAANLHKWKTASSDKCQCGGVQTMSHIVESCPLTRFDSDLLRLHSADDCAVTWLQNIAVKASAKWNESLVGRCHCILFRCWAVCKMLWTTWHSIWQRWRTSYKDPFQWVTCLSPIYSTTLTAHWQVFVRNSL